MCWIFPTKILSDDGHDSNDQISAYTTNHSPSLKKTTLSLTRSLFDKKERRERERERERERVEKDDTMTTSSARDSLAKVVLFTLVSKVPSREHQSFVT